MNQRYSTIPPEMVKFPVVRVDVWLKDFNLSQKGITADWAINKAMSECKITYIFEPKKGFNRKEWVIKKERMDTKFTSAS